jgi:hypothetical protein
VELTRWLGAAAVKRDLTDKMRDAQKKEVRRVCAQFFRCAMREASCFQQLRVCCTLLGK